MNKKIRNSILIVMLIIALILVSFNSKNLNLTGNVVRSNLYSHTKAICDDNNYCEDYYIECNGNILKKLTATGFSIQQDKNWIDSRNKTKLCN